MKYKQILFGLMPALLVLFSVFFFPNSALAATLFLSPASGSFTVGENFTVNVLLNTAGVNIEAVDIYSLRYNPTILQVQDGVTSTTGVQISPGTLLPTTALNSVNATAGTIQFSQLNLEGGYYNGTGTLASITFKALAAGTSAVTIDFSPGSTSDSNTSDTTSTDRLTGVTNGTYTVSGIPAQSTRFSIGDTVEATTTINVRATPSVSGTLLGAQTQGAQGTVVGGPTYANGYHWWQINYNT